MIPLYSNQQIREIDSFAINRLNIPGSILMENASINLSKIIIDKTFKYRKSAYGILCGKGNNGGDGFALARHLRNDGLKVKVLYLGLPEEMSPDARMNFQILQKLAENDDELLLKNYISKKDIRFLSDCSIIIDALLGSGSEGDLREPYKNIIKSINNYSAFKIAVDIPTGLDVNTGYSSLCFHSDLTISLAGLKKGLFFGDGYANAGEICLARIGVNENLFDDIPVQDYLIEPEDAFEALPKKKKDAHKYSSGKLLIVAGSEQFPGAALLTARAALKIGTGSVILAFPNSIKKYVHKNLMELVVQGYEDKGKGFLSTSNLSELKKKLDWAEVISIGPGLGRNPETLDAVREIILEYSAAKKIVIDADGLYSLNENFYKRENLLRNVVLTPHHGEFSDLVGITVGELKKDILRFGKDFSTSQKSYLVLKGAPTIVFTPSGEALINSTGNPGLAKFGSGDVLTGILSGLLSQKKIIEDAVISAVYLHSLSADLLLKKMTEYGILAGDIIENIPNAIKFLRKSVI
jgi:NAD(P)H-hydrate epimerase